MNLYSYATRSDISQNTE